MTQNSLSERDQQELERRRSENKRLKTERDILNPRSIKEQGRYVNKTRMVSCAEQARVAPVTYRRYKVMKRTRS